MADIRKIASEIVGMTEKELSELSAILKEEYNITGNKENEPKFKFIKHEI